jgi:putative acetyltransferase
MDVTADGRSLNALGLAPLAVVPEKTRHGIGSALVEAGIAEARQAGVDVIFVLGDGQIYGRLGFDPDAARPFASR